MSLLEFAPDRHPILSGSFCSRRSRPFLPEKEGICISPGSTGDTGSPICGARSSSRIRRRLDLSRSGIAIESTDRLVRGMELSVGARGPGRAAGHDQRARVGCEAHRDRRERGRRSGAGLSRRARVPGRAVGRGEPELFDRLYQERARGHRHHPRARYKISELASTLLLRGQSMFEVRTLTSAAWEPSWSTARGWDRCSSSCCRWTSRSSGAVASSTLTPAAENPFCFLV